MNFRDSPVRRGRCALAGLVAAITMAACGGGSSQIKDFRAEEVYAFGDEASVLTADGRKYSVNALDSSGARDCATEPIWVQRVAALYDLVFAECNPNALPATLAFMRAAPGAVAADLSGQIDVVEAAGFVPDHSLATVLIGANDIWALYAEYPTRSEDELADAS
ncbi:MAG: esterase, partial [Rubrivivax sp.]